MRKATSGFTIVELLIVIVVIAILATISVVAYQGIQVRADTAARLSEMMSWKRAFEVYRASTGGWPSSMPHSTDFCLGKGFPIGAGGVARCRDYDSTTTGYLESNNDALMDQLRTVVQVPLNSPKKLYGTHVGPYASIDMAGTLFITQIFSIKSGTCPEGTLLQYQSYIALWCEVRLTS